MLSSSRNFVVAILCPQASFSDLLTEAKKHDVTVLEMIPAQPDKTDYKALLADNRQLLFVYGSDKSAIVSQLERIPAAKSACDC